MSLAKIIEDIDIESEDPTSPSIASDDAVQSAGESESGTPSTSVKPMTTRQAVLASVVDSSHVSLSDSYFSPLRLISLLNNLHCVCR